jgi:hypothetical protein
MPSVASVDYITKRIYLSVSTVNQAVDTLDIYKEIRALRVTTEAHRRFKPMIVAGGNVTKITGVSATPIFVQLLYGCRIVPYGTGDHSLRLIRDTFTDDGFAGRDVFDRSGLSNSVDIDVDFPEVEIRYVYVGGSSLTKEDIRIEMDTNSTKLQNVDTKTSELWQLQGLDPLNRMTVTQNKRSVGTINLDITGNGETLTVVTRND